MKKGWTFPPRRSAASAAMIVALLGVLNLPTPGGAVEPLARLSVVFDNVSHDQRLKTGWGFACFIEGFGPTILFDTGGEGRILLSNMAKLNLSPRDVEVVFLSHAHGDHVGGLEHVLAQNPKVKVYAPASFPSSFHAAVRAWGAETMAVRAPMPLFRGVHSTGEMGSGIKEQGLVLETPQGLVLVTGCAHPGIVSMIRHTRARFEKPIYLVMGGFHLSGKSSAELLEIARELRELKVKKMAPSHCTGQAAMKLFRELWGEDYIKSGVGAMVELRP